MLTLLWGLPGEEPLAAVCESLADAGVDTLLLDQREILDSRMEINDVVSLCGSLECGRARIRLEDITSCYIRPYDSRRVPVVAQAGPASAEWRYALSLEDVLLQWLELTPALVVNRPSAMQPNQSKPFQLSQIAKFEFSIPETLVTTDPREVEAFAARHTQIIYKSVSGERSRVSRLSAGQMSRLGDVVNCPTQFQEFIPGSDFRVHVVGSDVFGCRIVSDADDYRYPGGSRKPPGIYAARLPACVEARAIHMTGVMGLHLSGIDLRCTAEGEWYCFEVNPSPAFTYYEQYTGQPIASSIARLLANPPAVSAFTDSTAPQEEQYDITFRRPGPNPRQPREDRV